MQPSAYMDRVRCSRPLVHHITNYVTVNDCANITICAGGSPVMADQESDAADIASVSSCLVINMGTVNERTFASMLAAGKAANDNGVPVVFGPEYRKFREAHGLVACGGGFPVKNYRTLAATLDDLFANPADAGRKAGEYVQSERGATDRLMHDIFEN